MKRKFKVSLFFILLAIQLVTSKAFTQEMHWQLGPFTRIDEANPIIKPDKESTFFCPVQKKLVHWECDHTFNPGAVVHNGKACVLYRAEDDFGLGIGCHTSRLGFAESVDGIHFSRKSYPILYPDQDDQLPLEWPGGCEDPRIVSKEDGTYIMTYTQWTQRAKSNDNSEKIPNRPLLGVASSQDLLHWKKHGYAFNLSQLGPYRSKSGSIVCKQIGDKLIATKINDKYWMYWGVGSIFIATSDDLITWEPILDDNGKPLAVLDKRSNKFDSQLVEPGPPALLTENGILLLYNGKNAEINGDPTISVGAYSAGQVLFDRSNPIQIIHRAEDTFFKPSRDYEKTGQYKKGTVFIEGLIPYQGYWYLYYGTADSFVGVARCPLLNKNN